MNDKLQEWLDFIKEQTGQDPEELYKGAIVCTQDDIGEDENDRLHPKKE